MVPPAVSAPVLFVFALAFVAERGCGFAVVVAAPSSEPPSPRRLRFRAPSFVVEAFSPPLPPNARHVLGGRVRRRCGGVGPSSSFSFLSAVGGDGDYFDEDEEDEEEEEDWRAFRAKLVMSESTPDAADDGGGEAATAVADAPPIPINIDPTDDSDLDGIGAIFGGPPPTATLTVDERQQQLTPLDPSQWAYDSGKVIEKGAVILGGVEQDFGFGLRQQYFHKSVILVVDHDERRFTKGIILNRPSDKTLVDDVNGGDGTNLTWRAWFGGDVQGLDAPVPDVLCLHSLRGDEAREASVTIMKDIQWTTFENAKKLVKKGVASGPEDFWLFAGYAGWGPGQLSSELDRKSWYMCATDSRTLLKELSKQTNVGAGLAGLGGGVVDPRDAGLDTWELLMRMIGKGEAAEKSSGQFDDLILKEWGRKNLLTEYYGDLLGGARKPSSDEGGGSGGGVGRDAPAGSEVRSVDDLMKEAADMVLTQTVVEGAVLRGSSSERSPFLLQKQEFHKSLVLIILEDDKASVGTILNHPATKEYDIEGIGVPLRYGGDYAVKGQSALLWLHCNKRLREAGVGSRIGSRKDGRIYKCTQDDVAKAVSIGIAETEDFLLVSGVCVWPKVGGSSLANEVKRGTFEVVRPSRLDGAFDKLRKQARLTAENISTNVELLHEAWAESGAAEDGGSSGARGEAKNDDVLTVGIGEGFDEDDDSMVYNSDVKVNALADSALRKWVATFLLGEPTL